MSEVRFRLAKLDDADSMAAIYNFEVEHSTATYDLVPRSLAEQRQWITERSGAFAAIVAVSRDNSVIGFAALSTYRNRAAYRTTVENSVYVHRNHRQEGVGRLLLEELIDLAEVSGFHTIVARIDSESVGSLALHQSVGFKSVGIEREVGRKFGRWLNSVIMQKILEPNQFRV